MWVIIYVVGIFGGIFGAIYVNNSIKEYKKDISKNNLIDKTHINTEYLNVFILIAVSVLSFVALIWKLISQP